MTELKSGRRRGAEKQRVRKLSVSLSPQAVESAYADMEARGIPTISEYLDWLVMERAADNDLRALVDEMLAGKPPLTDDERAWAEAAFRA